MKRPTSIHEVFRSVAMVLDHYPFPIGICSAIDRSGATGDISYHAKKFVQKAMTQCVCDQPYAYGEGLRIEGFTGPKEENREARILAALWLALEAEEEGACDS